MSRHQQTFANGIWNNNPALVQVLGLCPLLAVSNSAINGLGLGLATLLVLLISNTVIALLRRHIPATLRIPIFILLIASLTSVVQLLMQAYTFRLHEALGIFIPLIVTNCIIMGRAESFASRHPVSDAIVDGLGNGIGFCLALFILGSMREIIGTGYWMQGASQLFGTAADALTIQFVALDNAFLLAILPPGAFIGLGLLIAAKNALHLKQISRIASQPNHTK